MAEDIRNINTCDKLRTIFYLQHAHSPDSIEHLPNGQHQEYSCEPKVTKMLTLEFTLWWTET